MRHILIALLAGVFVTACSDEPEKAQQQGAEEHTIEQAADQAAAGMDAAGEETEVVTETAEQAGDAVEQAADATRDAAEDAAESVKASADQAAAEVEEAAEEVAGRDPKAIYNTYCVACHAQGVAGATKLSDTAGWQERIDARGRDGLVQNALNGYNAMPAKGTCSDCSEEEITATVEWMLAEAGL